MSPASPLPPLVLPGLTAMVLRPGSETSPAAPLPPELADLSPGSRIPLRIAAITTPPDSSGAPSPSGGTPALLLPGTVRAPGSAGSGALIQTSAGTLALPPGLILPRGEPVWLEVIGPPQPPPAPTVSLPPAGLTAQGWPALAEALTLLTNTAPEAALLVRQALPRPDLDLATTLTRFALALREGFPRLPGTTALTEALEQADRADLATRIERDCTELKETARESRGPDGRWQALTIPLLFGGRIEPIRLFVHHREDEGGGAGGQTTGGGERRFMIEIALTHLGRIQLDGLVTSTTKRFDLIVRTAQPLAAGMRQDIAAIFTRCGEVSGVKGGLSFQAGRGFVDLLPPIPDGTNLTA